MTATTAADWTAGVKPALTVEEAAKLLGISRNLAFKAVQRGDLPAVRIGRRILIPLSRLQAFLDGDITEGDQDGGAVAGG